jgi:hypothetical protein
MLNQVFGAIAALGTAEAQNLLALAGENVLKRYKDSHAWEKLLVNTGEFFLGFEQEATGFFEDLALVLSKENMVQIAKNLQADDGYGLQHKLYDSFMQLMRKYEIPYEMAEIYTMRIIYAVLEQLKTINPDKYEHYFLQEWRDEQEKSFQELQTRIDKVSSEISIYQQNKMAIVSSGQMDIELKRSTHDPSIGIQYFVVDDERFQEKFEGQKYEEIIYVRGRNREETIYCVLNELWRLNDRRPVYVVKNPESWDKLQKLGYSGNIYIPWFYADEIVAIENNTNIFVIDENTPVFRGNVLELRPRTHDTLSKCLQNAGMEYSKAYALLADTHGLYAQIKKRLFYGEYLKQPSWISCISEKAKKTCLLIGSWEEIDGDKLIIESLYGDSYNKFIEEILPYAKGDDPFLYMINRNGYVTYYLASFENIWSYLNVLPNEPIWQAFIKAFLDVINEAESLFIYDQREALVARIKGERLFWSETIRKGMLKTLLIKGAYQNDEETQQVLNNLVCDILDCVKSEKQWIYIAKFWKDLCEISPKATLERLEKELNEDTGLLSLFQNKSSDFLLGRNAYIDILWGLEQFLTQRDYFWPAFRWLLKLDSYQFEYKSNSPKDTFSKVFCTWMDFSSLQNEEEKITAAKIAFEINPYNTWDYLISAIDSKGRSIFGELSYPKYREHEIARSITIAEMQKTSMGYFNLLIQHMDYSADRWIKMIDLSSDLPADLRHEAEEKLLSEINQMPDEDAMRVKNGVRHHIYRHRFYSSSDWSMPAEDLAEYEVLLNGIKLQTPELEYSYLFINNPDYPLLHPVPYDQEGEMEKNEKATDELIQKSLKDFQNRRYDLAVLATACARESNSTLGKYLAKYWNEGEWDYAVFKRLLPVQASGTIALEYLAYSGDREVLPFKTIISDLSSDSCSTEILAKVYRIEAFRTKGLPLVTDATEAIKKEFWKSRVLCDESNEAWLLNESKKHASLDIYLDQIHMIHYRNPMSADQIYECFDGIEKMPQSVSNQMTSYHVEQLIAVLQDAFIGDTEKCIRISRLEVFFMNLLDWKNMKCFQRMIKQVPELFAELVSGVFKKDHPESTGESNNREYVHSLYTIYEKARFCPAERDGIVDEDQLEQWIEEYRKLLIKNDQMSLFTSTLGRLFAFSPTGIDGHEPCEAVRKMIEKYGDDRMIRSYQTTVYNRRGVFSPSAGKEELRIAEEFRENARHLEPHYPMTAKVFFGLYETYKRESDREREDAENGW